MSEIWVKSDEISIPGLGHREAEFHCVLSFSFTRGLMTALSTTYAW